MPEPIATLNEESLRTDLRELVRRTVEDILNGLLEEADDLAGSSRPCGTGVPSSSRPWSTRPLAAWIDTAMLEGESGLVWINLTMRIRALTCGSFLRMV